VSRFSFGFVPWEVIVINADTNPFAVGIGMVNGKAGNVGVSNFQDKVDNGDFKAV
jgi:hypothetical protein